MKYRLRPQNKHIVVRDFATDNKVGMLYIPDRASHSTFAQAEVVAVAPDVDEKFEAKVGDRVIYDTIGSVDHRVGNQSFKTVKALNVVSVVEAESGEDE